MAHPLTAKQALLQFLDKHGLRSGLKIEVQMGPPPPAPPHFKCTAHVPVFEAKAATFVPKPFEGEGATKKASEHAAAHTALIFLNSQGLLPENLKGAIQTELPSQPKKVEQADASNHQTLATLQALLQQSKKKQTPSPAIPQQIPQMTAQQIVPGLEPVDPQAIPMRMNEDDQADLQQPPESGNLQQMAGENLNSLPESRGARPPNSSMMPYEEHGAYQQFPPRPMGIEAEIEAQLGNKSLYELTPLQLKEELQKALDRNTELKGAIHHEQQRREKALSVLLGLS